MTAKLEGETRRSPFPKFGSFFGSSLQFRRHVLALISFAALVVWSSFVLEWNTHHYPPTGGADVRLATTTSHDDFPSNKIAESTDLSLVAKSGQRILYANQFRRLSAAIKGIYKVETLTAGSDGTPVMLKFALKAECRPAHMSSFGLQGWPEVAVYKLATMMRQWLDFSGEKSSTKSSTTSRLPNNNNNKINGAFMEHFSSFAYDAHSPPIDSILLNVPFATGGIIVVPPQFRDEVSSCGVLSRAQAKKMGDVMDSMGMGIVAGKEVIMGSDDAARLFGVRATHTAHNFTRTSQLFEHYIRTNHTLMIGVLLTWRPEGKFKEMMPSTDYLKTLFENPLLQRNNAPHTTADTVEEPLNIAQKGTDDKQNERNPNPPAERMPYSPQAARELSELMTIDYIVGDSDRKHINFYTEPRNNGNGERGFVLMDSGAAFSALNVHRSICDVHTGPLLCPPGLQSLLFEVLEKEGELGRLSLLPCDGAKSSPLSPFYCQNANFSEAMPNAVPNSLWHRMASVCLAPQRFVSFMGALTTNRYSYKYAVALSYPVPASEAFEWAVSQPAEIRNKSLETGMLGVFGSDAADAFYKMPASIGHDPHLDDPLYSLRAAADDSSNTSATAYVREAPYSLCRFPKQFLNDLSRFVVAWQHGENPEGSAMLARLMPLNLSTEERRADLRTALESLAAHTPQRAPFTSDNHPLMRRLGTDRMPSLAHMWSELVRNDVLLLYLQHNFNSSTERDLSMLGRLADDQCERHEPFASFSDDILWQISIALGRRMVRVLRGAVDCAAAFGEDHVLL